MITVIALVAGIGVLKDLNVEIDPLANGGVIVHAAVVCDNDGAGRTPGQAEYFWRLRNVPKMRAGETRCLRDSNGASVDITLNYIKKIRLVECRFFSETFSISGRSVKLSEDGVLCNYGSDQRPNWHAYLPK